MCMQAENFSTNCTFILHRKWSLIFAKFTLLNMSKELSQFRTSYYNGSEGRLKIIVMMASKFYCEGNFLYSLRGLEVVQVQSTRAKNIKIFMRECIFEEDLIVSKSFKLFELKNLYFNSKSSFVAEIFLIENIKMRVIL